jgi:hypothetical protein
VYVNDVTTCSGHDIFGSCNSWTIVPLYRLYPAVAQCPAGKVALFGWTDDGAVGASKMSNDLLVGWQAGTMTETTSVSGASPPTPSREPSNLNAEPAVRKQ